MTATLLFLPATADDAWRWMRIADDAIVARGEGIPDADDSAVIAIAPAADVALNWAALPDRSLAQATAAARIVVSDAAAAPIETLHVAVGDEAREERPIGLVASARMRDWLAALAGLGIDPVAMLPAPLLLPRPDAGYLRADVAGQGLVRGATSGFADEARLTALVTGGATPETLGRDALDAAIVANVAAPVLDLRQGAFARRKRRAIDWALVRRLALLAGLILLATLAIDLVRIAKYSFGADRIDAQAEALARSGLPRGADAGDADRLLAERLSRLRGPGAGFSATAAAVSDAVRGVSGTEVNAIDFQPNGDLRVTIVTAGEAQANALVERLRASGLGVTASAFESSGGRLKGDITVTPR